NTNAYVSGVGRRGNDSGQRRPRSQLAVNRFLSRHRLGLLASWERLAILDRANKGTRTHKNRPGGDFRHTALLEIFRPPPQRTESLSPISPNPPSRHGRARVASPWLRWPLNGNQGAFRHTGF